MIQDDFVMRQIARLAQALRKVMGLRQAERLDDALQSLDEAYKDEFALDRATLMMLSASSLRVLLAQNHAPEDLDALMGQLALLLMEEGHIRAALGQQRQAAACWTRAASILEGVAGNNETHMEALMQCRALLTRV